VGDFPGPPEDWPSALAFSSDGKTLAVGFSNEVRVWDVPSRQLLDTITPNIPARRITGLAFAPDGQTLAMGTASRVLLLWDAKKKQSQVISYMPVDSMAFSPDGKLLATAARGSPAVLWDTSHWVKQFVLTDAISGGAGARLAFSPDGKSLAVSYGGDSVQVWDMDRMVKTHLLTIERYNIDCLAFAPDGHTLAAGAYDRAVMVWDICAVGAVAPGTPAPTAVPEDLAFVFPQPLQPGSLLAINNVKMFDGLAGWGSGLDDGPWSSLAKNHLLHTVDGGQTWREAALPAGVEPGDFFALDADTAWVALAFQSHSDEKGVFIPTVTLSTWRTTDGGQTWQQSKPFSLTPRSAPDGSGVDEYGVKLQFLDRSNGWMLFNLDAPEATAQRCQWQLYQTGDGGLDWQRVSNADPFGSVTGSCWPTDFSMLFWDGAHGWVAGVVYGSMNDTSVWNLALPVTNDGGQTWDTIPIPAPHELPVDFHNNQFQCNTTSIERITAEAAAVRTECMVLKDSILPVYTFYHLTPDRGKTWRAWQTNGSEDFISATTGWRLESSVLEQVTRILQTSDSGATWEVISSVPWFGNLDFVSDQVGWAVARQEEARALLMTIDGGKTWVEVKAMVGR
jgi:photosystem II stability/assembly factor-like uncharacterized protein